MLKDFLKNLFKKIDFKKLEEWYKGFYVAKPNGLLDGIPLFVISTSYTQDNEITGYKSYLKENFNENMFINPYTLQVEAMVHGLDFIEELEELAKLSKERKYTFFAYTKLNNKVFAPVAITNFNYSEDYTAYTGMKITFNLKEVNLLEFVTDDNGVTTTNVYNPNGTTQNRELEPISLNENLHEKYNGDTRTQGVI